LKKKKVNSKGKKTPLHSLSAITPPSSVLLLLLLLQLFKMSSLFGPEFTFFFFFFLLSQTQLFFLFSSFLAGTSSFSPNDVINLSDATYLAGFF